MKQESKLREQTAHVEAKPEAQAKAREFSSAEEVLCADAAQVEVPAAVKSRLADSISQEMPAKPDPWWKKLFGG